jgi:hypothetical protein
MPRPRHPGLYLYKFGTSQKRKLPDAELPEVKRAKYGGGVGTFKEEEESLTESETEGSSTQSETDGSVTEPETDSGPQMGPETDAEPSQMVNRSYNIF